MEFFKLAVDVINGQLKEFPETIYFKCSNVVPVGNTVIRFFTDDMCQVAHKTFYIRYGLDLFGTSQFTTEQQFWDYTNCYPTITFALINGCNLTINGSNALIN